MNRWWGRSRARASRVGAVGGSLALAVASLVAGVGGAAVHAAPAAAAGTGTPWIVSVGDSAISGEAGRWAGNTNDSYTKVDALGSTAYYDNSTNTGEQISGCHRSKSAEVFVGTGLSGKNLACSGAQTSTHWDGSTFKPGLDFYDDGAGNIGQAKMLQQFATGNDVKAVVVLIGANNFHFADIVQTCVTDWLTSPSWWPNYCYNDSNVASNFTSSYIAAQTTAVKDAILRVRQAMLNAGYADSAYTLFVQTYSSPIPRGSGFRYSQSGWTRQSVGGCGIWNKDADWANDTAVTKINSAVTNGAAATGLGNIKILNDVGALNGRRLCENTVGLLEERGIASWTSPGAVDNTEWVSQIRTTSTLFGPYQLQEDLHPSYWGQMALRNCLRLAYNGGATRGGTCTRAANGLNVYGEPIMQLL